MRKDEPLEARVQMAIKWLDEDEARYLEQMSREPNVRIRARMKAYTRIKPWAALRRLLLDLLRAATNDK